jgi:hypothetical protein
MFLFLKSKDRFFLKTKVLGSEWLRCRILDVLNLIKITDIKKSFQPVKIQMLVFLAWGTAYPFLRIILGKNKAHKICNSFLNIHFSTTIMPLSPISESKIKLGDHVGWEAYLEICVYDIYIRELLKKRDECHRYRSSYRNV